MMKQLKTRLATVDDLDQILNLIKLTIAKLTEDKITIWDEVYPAQFIPEEISQNRLYVSFLDDVLISCFALNHQNRGSDKVMWPTQSDKAIYLDKFCVHPLYQNKGFGRKVIDSALQISDELGFEVLRLFVVDFNTPALNFYDKLHFSKANGLFYDQIEERHLTEIGYEKHIN